MPKATCQPCIALARPSSKGIESLKFIEWVSELQWVSEWTSELDWVSEWVFELDWVFEMDIAVMRSMLSTFLMRPTWAASLLSRQSLRKHAQVYRTASF